MKLTQRFSKQKDVPDDFHWLQKGLPGDRHCFQHSCSFKTESGYRKHLEECSSLFNKPYLCTVVEHDKMCGKSHNTAAQVFYHVYFKHKMLLCEL